MRYEWSLLMDAIWHEKGRLGVTLVAIVLCLLFFSVLPGCAVVPPDGIVGIAYADGKVVNYVITPVNPYENSLCIDAIRHNISGPILAPNGD